LLLYAGEEPCKFLLHIPVCDHPKILHSCVASLGIAQGTSTEGYCRGRCVHRDFNKVSVLVGVMV